MKDNTRSRKYILTINNPVEHGFNHETINETMKSIKWTYYCLCDEIGKENTYHTHLYFVCENAIGFKKIKSLFPTAHIDIARGTSQENKNYILKEGKYKDTEKAETNIKETFEEYGEMPLDTKTKNEGVAEQVLTMIEDGCSDLQIIKEHPSYMNKQSAIERTRQLFMYDKFSKSNRDVKVAYIYGETGVGKTRFVIDKFGFEEVYKVINYDKHPFDNYKFQDVLLLDEFNSSLNFEFMLQLLDIYPLQLPARYADRVACFTKIFILSNLPFSAQYADKRVENRSQYDAFLRRIDCIFEMKKGGELISKSKYDNKVIEGDIF